MRCLFLFVLFLLVSTSTLATDKKLESAVKDLSSKNVSYILIDGKLKAIVPVGDAQSTQQAFAWFGNKPQYWGVEDMLSAIQVAKDEIAKDVCKNKLKPSNVTITIYLVSLTWDTEKLCKE